ncbi:MAG: phosphate acyltransferase PlsX [Eubacteriales bacterium]|jgi:glycerol-3-phosphate acyltransferase PlsX
MRILIDAMSGDHAPLEIIHGAVMAASAYDCEITLIGDEDTILNLASEHNLEINRSNIQLVHSSSIISMEDAPLSVVREKSDSSMAVGLKMLAAGEGDAFVSAGNTGALYAGSTLIVRRIKGVKKAAIATIMPFGRPMLMLDCGANVELAPEAYVQLAQMGTIYMRSIFGIPSPEVGLLNIGEERTKGTKLLVDVYNMLEQDPTINFKGNIEGKELPYGVCDVLVTDGFTGNIVLKLTEGCSSFLMQKIKDIFYSNFLTKASALFVKKGMTKLKNEFSASQYGGAPLLGISRPVIKAHGSSDAEAIKNAVRQAIGYINTGIIYEIARLTVGDELGE